VCDALLGVQENVGRNALEQLIYPFKVAVRFVLRHSGAREAREERPKTTLNAAGSGRDQPP